MRQHFSRGRKASRSMLRLIRKGKLEDWDDMPTSKTLFKSMTGCGLPIGNLTSQLFSNVYLNSLDHYMKTRCKCRHYGRYVDDFYVVANSKERLRNVRDKAQTFLMKELGLKINTNKTIIKDVCLGIDFLGAFLKPHRLYIRNSTIKKMRNKINMMHDNIIEYMPNQVRCSLNSFLGLMKRYRTFNIRRNILKNQIRWDAYGIFKADYSKFYPYKSIFYHPPHTLLNIYK